MPKHLIFLLFIVLFPLPGIIAGERSIVSLQDFRSSELKMTGIECLSPTTLHIKGTGGERSSGWGSKGGDLFAYGWIIDARTRELVWKMSRENTRGSGDDRTCDDRVSLGPGAYEIYFAAPTFSYNTWTSHFGINVDHRKKPLFGERDGNGLWFLEDWWFDDLPETWEKRSKNWGIDILVDDPDAHSIHTFSPPRKFQNVIFQSTSLGENELVRQGLKALEPVELNIYALGEERKDLELVDYAWVVNATTRERVWEMTLRNTHGAEGADKNVMFSGTVRLDKGEYVLYYITDDSHSADDWNTFPPADPLHWGVTLSAKGESEKRSVELYPYHEDENVILSITKIGDNATRQEEFTLKEDARIRIYAFGERSNSRRTLADYGYIMDARTREKVWTMDVDRCFHAGGASKNLYADEIVTLMKGSYILTYKTDDSHSYDDWNAAPPFDEKHYGITLMGVGKGFNNDIISKESVGRGQGVIAQITRVGNDGNREERVKLSRPTRVRIYAIGEGQKRSMFDYGLIENTENGVVIWEMTYGMTFHAGGARKNRVVNTTILLEKGEYLLRYISDDSHSYGDWNEEPPEDQEFWGITLYEEGPDGHPSHPIPEEP